MPYYPDIADRIRQLAKELKTDQAGLARLAGVSKTASGNWFAARACPERAALANLKKNARVNDEWLISGKGDMFIVKNAPSIRDEGYITDPETVRLLTAWKQLPHTIRQHYLALMEYTPAPSAEVMNKLPSRRITKKAG